MHLGGGKLRRHLLPQDSTFNRTDTTDLLMFFPFCICMNGDGTAKRQGGLDLWNLMGDASCLSSKNTHADSLLLFWDSDFLCSSACQGTHYVYQIDFEPRDSPATDS